MSRLTILLLTLTVPTSITASCGVGTLSCSKSSGTPKSVICDFFNSYVLDPKTFSCKKTSVPNCLVPKLPHSSSSCYLCKNGHVIDSQTNQCVPVQAQSLKENCEQYSTPSFSCLKCASDFYVSAGACMSLGEERIEYCDIYKSQTECQVCQPGTYLEDKKCKVFSPIQNCYLHRNIKCDRCQDDHFLNSSANPPFNQSTFLFNTFDFSMYVKSDPTYEYFTRDFSSEVCQKGSINQCKVYDSFSTCKECHEGYYVNTSKRCDRLQEPPISGCEVYTSATVCAKCKFKYILNQSTGQCSEAKDVESCAEYHATQNKCIRCEKKLYLSGSGMCTGERVDSVSIASCEETAPDKDECLECKEGYSLSSRNKFCYKDIVNCTDQVKSNEIDKFHTCRTCKENFYPSEDKSKCNEAKILRCLELVPQKNECQKCEDGFYFESEKAQCVNQFVENCEEYIPQTNQCKKCSNLYYQQGEYCLLIISSELCQESDGLRNECAKCKPQYLKSGTTCSSLDPRSLEVIDSKCISNTETTKTSDCTECAEDHFILAGTNRAVLAEDMTVLNCAKVDYTNGKCVQCVENSSGDGSKCLAPDSSLTSECLQLMENSFTTLANGNCAKCRDIRQNYLDSTNNYCTRRTNPTINENCAEFPEDDGDCLSCQENFFPHAESELRDQCVNTAEFPGYNTITNCTIYDINKQTCFLCRQGYKLNIDGKTCQLNAYTVNLNFDNNFNIASPTIPDQDYMINNCKTYHQVDLNVIRCSECNNQFVSIVKVNLSEGETLVYDYFSLGINVGLGGFSLPVEQCVDFKNSYKMSNGTSSITTDVCDVGIQFEDKPGYACIRCKINYNGRIQLVDKDMNGNALGTTLKVIEGCFSSSEFTNTFDGVGYHLRYQENYIPYVIYMRYSNCQNSANSLIFNSIVEMNGNIRIEQIKGSNGVVLPIVECKNISQGNVFYNNNLNCQIFGYSSLPAPTFNIQNPPVNLCLACKPGYKAVLVPGTGRIQSCVQITDCNNFQNGKYLNGCSDPTTGYKLDTLENNQLILFDDLVQTPNQIENCLVYTNDSQKCVVCKKNYSLIRGSCTDVKTQTATYNCTTPGYGLNDLNLHYSVNTNKRLMNYTYFLVNKFNVESVRKTICSSCSSGNIVGIYPNKNKPKCFPVPKDQPSLTIDNCIKYKASSPVICHVCGNGYIPNELTGKCIAKQSYTNCTAVTGLTELKCSSCDDNYVVDDLGKCVQSNCKRTLQGKCALCDDGYKTKQDSEISCEQNLDPSDDCLAYSPSLKTCGKCRNGGVLYLFYEKENGEFAYKGFSCEPGLLIPGTLPGWRHYHLDEVYIKVDYDSSTNGVMSALTSIKNDSLEGRLFINSEPDKNPANSHCFNKRVIENCIPEFMLGGVFCSKCQNGYMINKSTNKCELSSAIPFCGIYLSEKECEECLPTHYLAGPTQCVKYLPNMNCKEIFKDKNQCKSCEEGFFLNFTKICEQRRNDLNCETFLDSENKCGSCKEGYLYKASNRTCNRRTAQNCEEVHTSQDKCTKCKSGYWMDNSSGDICRKSKEVAECKEYLPSADGCQTCNEQYYATDEGQKCKERPDGILGCEVYSDFGICAKCHAQNFLMNNQCREVTNPVDNCKYYVADGRCMECEPSYFLDQSTNTCTTTSVSNCVEFSSATTCKKCEPNYVLTWDELTLTCEPSDITDCLVSIGGSTKTCMKCESGKVLSTDKTTCETPSAPAMQCEEFYSTVQCKQCKLGYVLSKDWKMCEQKPISVSTLKTNCASEVTNRSMICDVCKPGFKKNSKGVCESCGGNGCYICGSGFTSCNLCKSSFHMNSELKCVPNASSQASDFVA